MTVLTLDIVIARILGANPPAGGIRRCVSALVDGMTPLTEALHLSALLERRERVGVRRLLPLGLLANVAVAADSFVLQSVAESEKSRGGGGRRLEQRAVTVRDVGAGDDTEAA